MKGIPREKSLAAVRPDLLSEWHPTKNGDLTPYDVRPCSDKKVWWHLPYEDPKTGKHFDFEWEARISNRRNGNGCPFLCGKEVWPGFNDLETNYPELSKEWHPTKNGDLTPRNVSFGSGKKVWWFLSYDDPLTGKRFNFEWQAVISNRIAGRGCPYLIGKDIWKGFNDLLTTHPNLAAEWHPTKNDGLKPDMVMAGSNKKVWWYLPYDDHKTGRHFDFEWKATIASRVSGVQCPYLCGYAVWPGFNDLKTTHSELLKEWHPTKNGNLKPENISFGSDIKVWWIYPYDDPLTGKHFDFEWQSTISTKLAGNGCPVLSGSSTWPGFNDLATTHPNVAKEWHPTKNGKLTPQNVSSGSGRKAWWLLPYDDPITGKHFDFEWQATIAARVKGSGCPYLAGSAVWSGFNDLQTTHPDIAKDLHPTKNGKLKATDITYGSNKKVWWLKEYNGEWKEWYMPVCDRTLRRYECPGIITSRLETITSTIMKSNNIDYEIERKFDDLRSEKGYHYRYDFYLPKLGILIECDGEQHFKNSEYYFREKGGFDYRISSDNIKNTYAKKNNMALLRIPHIYDTPSKKDELEEIVLDFIKTKQLPEKIINFYSNYEFSNYVNVAKQREKIKNSAKRKKGVRYL